MKEITIRKETRPTRCEICHQSDMFDPETSQCQRCENIVLSVNNPIVAARQQIATIEGTLDFMALGAAFFGILAFAPGLFLPPLGLVLSILGVICGKKSLTNIRNRQGALSGESFAYIGLYCGGLGFLLALFLILFIIKSSK
ncbi:MAG: hypothetical protein IPK14_24515 [Blastocatellia bacterium]|nr:hypothetical protein [Blastocatellia bacterium]MBL8193674.1 hypothetical protein [Blastocatellia bacterium]MBN8721771.1 hypothetical protein [Acidobacteriota bacterium]